MDQRNVFKDIELEFKKFRFFALLVAGFCIGISVLVLFNANSMVAKATDKIYVLDNGKTLLAAYKTNAEDNRPAEIRSHSKRLLNLLFSMGPDKAQIDDNISQALYLGDSSVYAIVSNLKESKFFDRMIAATASSKLIFDTASITVDISTYPYLVNIKCKNFITRTSVVEERDLFCSMDLRNVPRSDNNPHGLIVENLIAQSEIVNTFKRN